MSTPDEPPHPPTTPQTPPTNPTFGPCPKCGGSMEYGLLIDGGKQSPMAMRGFERAAQWVRGRPGKRFWDQSFDTGPQSRLEVATVRCTLCGFIELYAVHPAQ